MTATLLHASVLLAALLSPVLHDPSHEHERQIVYWDTLDEHGQLTGGRTELLLPARESLTDVIPAPTARLFSSAPTDGPGPLNRLYLVFVGDGYQAQQLGAYASHVNHIVGSFFDREPFKKYQAYFEVYRVDVVSVDSGVTNDPVQGIQKNTALGMYFWCGGIDRLLCVNVSSAYSYANNAPKVDLVAAIANSTTYGGAGYPSQNLGTSSGNNSASVEIVLHEFGHALGNLADEYTYGGPSHYNGPEPGTPNISKLNASQMAAAAAKWFRWLGFSNSAFDGLVSTFEGGGYSVTGIYRPTNNSLMRSLGRPFNLPGAEQIIFEIYRIVDPIESSSDPNVIHDPNGVLFVVPMNPVGHDLSVQWFLGDVPIQGATSTTLQLSSLGLGECSTTIRVRVRDDVAWVRDEDKRDELMTQWLDFQVGGGVYPVTPYCVTSPNSVGAGAVMGVLGSTSVSANDLELVAMGAPPQQFGVFFFGAAKTQVPFGDGVRCVGGQTFRLSVLTTDLFGDAHHALDLANLPPGAAIGGGDTQHFQLWYRDPAAGGSGFNLSDGLEVRFCP